MRGETLHTTLIFIGNVALHGLAVLKRAAQEVSVESFELCFDEARYCGHNHIVYAAPCHVPPQLLQLAAALEERLAAHRFEFDRREYQPHVTLLRNARWSDAPKADHPQPASGRAELIPPLPAMQPVCWKIKNFALVQSVPGDGLRDYRVLARFPLRAGGG